MLDTQQLRLAFVAATQGLADNLGQLTKANTARFDGHTLTELSANVLLGTVANAGTLGQLTYQSLVDAYTGDTSGLSDIEAQLAAFIARRDNPHLVTKEQLDLGNLVNQGFATLVETDLAATDKYISPAMVKHAIDQAIDALVGTAPETMDTLQELAEILQNNANMVADLINQVSGLISIVDAQALMDSQLIQANSYTDTSMTAKLAGAKIHSDANITTLKEILDNLFTDFFPAKGVPNGIFEILTGFSYSQVSSLQIAHVDGFIYLYGGNPYSNLDTAQRFYKYSIANKKLVAITTLTGGPGSIGNHQIIAVDGKLYIFGGAKATSGSLTYSKAGYIFDPVAGTWARMADAPVFFCDAVCYYANGAIYVSYGRAGSSQQWNFYKYDIAANSWTKVFGNYGMPLCYAYESVLVGDQLYYFETNGAGKFYRATIGVETLAELNHTELATAPAFYKAPAFIHRDGFIFVLGGTGGENVIQVYDIANDTWQVLEEVMPIKRRLTSHVNVGQSLFMFGGFDNTTTRMTNGLGYHLDR